MTKESRPPSWAAFTNHSGKCRPHHPSSARTNTRRGCEQILNFAFSLTLRCCTSNYGADVVVRYPSAVSIAPGALKSRSEEGIAHSMGSIAGEERGGTCKCKQLD